MGSGRRYLDTAHRNRLVQSPPRQQSSSGPTDANQASRCPTQTLAGRGARRTGSRGSSRLLRESRMRGANDADAQFRAAMRHYQQQDYAASVPGLIQAAGIDPKSSASQFYLGISQFLRGNRSLAISHLRIVAAMEDSLRIRRRSFLSRQGLAGRARSGRRVKSVRKSHRSPTLWGKRRSPPRRSHSRTAISARSSAHLLRGPLSCSIDAILIKRRSLAS